MAKRAGAGQQGVVDRGAVGGHCRDVGEVAQLGARTLRHAELSDARTEANQVSERMSRPLALLVTGLTLFVLVPFMLRMFGISS